MRPPQPSTGGLATVDLRAAATRVLAGNWIGSTIVAAVTLVTAGLLSLIVGLVAKPPDFGIDNSLTLGAVVVCGVFGADFFVNGTPQDIGGDSWDFGLSVAAFPLTITIVAFAVAVLAFQRMTRDYPTPWPALADALRVALLVALPLLVVSLVLRSDFDELGRGWFADAARDLDFGDDSTWGSYAAGAFFMPLFTITPVLILACVARRSWWTGRMRAVVEWVAPVLHGLAAFVALLPVAGVIGVGLLMFGGDRVDEDVDTGDTGAAWAAIAAFLGNGGLALLGLGAGADVGTAGREIGDGENSRPTDWHRLGWYAGDGGDEPGLWAAPLVLLVVLVASAWVVSRLSVRTTLLRNLLCWAASLLIAVPVLVRLANGHGTVHLDAGSETYESSGVMGLEGVQATFFITGIALLVALALAAARGGIDRQVLGALKRLQVDAGRSRSVAAGTMPPPPPPPSGPSPVTPDVPPPPPPPA
ncbi:hypothetical protein GCM10022242_04720 [Nocardioides panacisoli]|uniref:Cytochrome d ubiquinol oxidase subunit II n=2 Tax=Nocardioides panacisoli TaxID=627624 RepID=A0ABP7HX32_9ACTN